MPLPRLVADAFGVATISLVSIFVILGLLCIFYSVYFSSRIQKGGLLQLGYFNGPWITRIALIVIAIWWGCGEILRLSLLNGKGRLFTALTWQKGICKFYIISNIGFAEPSLFLIIVFLLHASLQKREYGVLSHRWNRKTTLCVILFCLPMFLLQLLLVLIGSNLNSEGNSRKIKIPKYFTSTSSLTGDSITCTYPLLSTVFLGLFDLMLVSYMAFLGFQMVSSVINKGLQRRIYFLIFSVVSFLPLRVSLLGFSVLPQSGGMAYEALVFLAFLMLLFCTLVAICMLVYYPVADSLALRELRHLELDETPFDDYYDAASSLMVNQSHFETERYSNASTMCSSISFNTMVKDEQPQSVGFGGASIFSSSSLPSPPIPGRAMIRRNGVSEC